MRLVRLEIRNYRSIQEQAQDEAIVFGGIDCLVGKNNAGKSNILKAILYLLGEERLEEGLYHGRKTSRVIDVRGFFTVDEADFELLKIEDKRENVKDLVLDDGTIGICRRSSSNDMEVIRLYPAEERLRPGTFAEFHQKAWEAKDSRAVFEERMRAEYPELESFLKPGKESNKGEWERAYEEFLSERPESVKFLKLPGPPPTGIPADPKNMLPRIVFIPAVKEVSDATKTTRTGELGRLLNELSAQVQEELDEAISRSLKQVYRRLNIDKDPETGRMLDERDPGVRAIERQITEYTAETFQGIAVRLEFPNPESKVMFDNARVLIQEEDFEEVPVDLTGEGVKRVLIFSLLRTLADLRQSKLSLSEAQEETEEPRVAHRPLLILYEEAELFLHPGLQSILLRAFDQLEQSGAQVIFTTHSPFMLQSTSLSTINLVSKAPETGTQVVELQSKMRSRGPKEQNTLLQVQNASSYIFCDRAVLVEGESDRIVLEKLAPALRQEWDFERNGIPVLSVVGQGNLPLFKSFLEALGIRAFVLADIDCIESMLPRLCDRDSVLSLRETLLHKCDQLVDMGEFAVKFNKKSISKLVSSYDWNEVIDVLDQLCNHLDAGQQASEKHIDCLRRLVGYREVDARTEALKSDNSEVVKLRAGLVDSLLDDNILLLNGTIEDYYPSEGGNKIEAALEFDPQSFCPDELSACFTHLVGRETTDMEAFLHQVFSS